MSLTAVTSIAGGDEYDPGLDTSDFPAPVFFYGYGAFYGCTALTTVSLPAAAEIGDGAFSGCTALTNVDLPAAAHIGDGAFSRCTALTAVDLSAAAHIGDGAFVFTGSAGLTVTLGATAPRLGENMFEFGSKSVTVLVPHGATGYGTVPSTYTGYDGAENWGNAFRGRGWDGTWYLSGNVNGNISLTITNTSAGML